MSIRVLPVLDLYLTVESNEPTWVVNPSSFEHSMTLVAQVVTDGGISTDPNDKLAAFVGGQLRGVAPIGVSGYNDLAFLTIYSNRTTGETVRFQVWDDDVSTLYNATDQTYPFEANDALGSPGSPYVLTASQGLAEGVLEIAVT